MGAFISWLKTNLPSDPASGEAQKGNTPQSLSGLFSSSIFNCIQRRDLTRNHLGMISTLVPILIVSSVYIVIFLLIRRSQSRFYAPRTYLGSIRERYILVNRNTNQPIFC